MLWIFMCKYFFLVSSKNIDANKMGQKWPFASFYKENMDECVERIWKVVFSITFNKTKVKSVRINQEFNEGFVSWFYILFRVTWYGNSLVK